MAALSQPVLAVVGALENGCCSVAPGTAIGKLCSFSGETEVLMTDGNTKPISQVEVGDDVAIGRTGDVYDARTGEYLGSLTDPGLGIGR